MRRRFLVEGAVQGVGFRYFTWRQARRLGLLGWVRNLPDDRVEVLAEGDAGRLEQFERELSRGPAMASVTQVRSSEISDDAEQLGSFEIR